MDSDYLELIHLIEEYKSHSENADVEIIGLRRQLAETFSKCERAEAESSHSFEMLREMEENVIHMDQEMSELRKVLIERDDEISKLQLELQQAKRNEKVTAGSGSLQLSTAKDETRRLRIANERLREQIDELEYTLNRQQSILLESNYAAPGAVNTLSSKNQSPLLNSSGNIYDHVILPHSPSPIQLSSLDIVIGDTEVSEPERVSFTNRQESPNRTTRSPRNRINESKIKSGERTSIAKEAAHAAKERENSVRPIINRRDGSFGLSPSRIKSSPSSVEKWAYTPEELTIDTKFGKKLLSEDTPGETSPLQNRKHLPIQPTKWSGQDEKDVIKIFNFSDFNEADKLNAKSLRDAKHTDSDEDVRNVRLGYAYNGDMHDKAGAVENEMRQKERSYHISRLETETSMERAFKTPKGKSNLRA